MSNCASLGGLPNLVKELGENIKDALLEIKKATDEVNENKAKLKDFSQECKKAKKETPRDCYLLVGKKIEKTPALIKEWKKNHPDKKKKAGKKEKTAATKGKAKRVKGKK